jgi:hypothetical protein
MILWLVNVWQMYKKIRNNLKKTSFYKSYFNSKASLSNEIPSQPNVIKFRMF